MVGSFVRLTKASKKSLKFPAPHKALYDKYVVYRHIVSPRIHENSHIGLAKRDDNL